MEILVICVAAFVMVFLLMMLFGPPNHLYCPNGRRHEWGNWICDTLGHELKKTCANCGYVERERL